MYYAYAAVALGASLIAYKYLTSKSADLSIFRGQSVWITGASSGIGKSLTIAFYKAGAHVILSGRTENTLLSVITDDLLPLSASMVAAGPPPPSVVVFDMAEVGSDEKLSQSVVDKVIRCAPSGQLHCVVHNAGLSMRALATPTSLESEKYVFNVNTFGPIALTKALLQKAALVYDARIVLISSVQGLLPLPLRAAYSASKHAVQSYFDSLRYELMLTPAIDGKHITVTTICPGYVCTNLSLNAMTSSGGKHNQLDSTTAGGDNSDVVAKKILEAAALRKKEVWIFPFIHKLAVLLQFICPDVIAKKMIKKAQGELEHLK